MIRAACLEQVGSQLIDGGTTPHHAAVEMLGAGNMTQKEGTR